MKIATHVLSLPMRHTFTIAHGSADAVDTFVVELSDGEHRGYGESQAVDYYRIHASQMQEKLMAVAARIESLPWQHPEELWAPARDLLEGDLFTLCALDQAAHDLWGKREGKPVYELFGLAIENVPPSDYTIGIDTIPNMVAKLNEFPGWPIYKIKLGTDEDIEIVRALREHTPATFRIDANCAWSAKQTIENSHALRELGVEFLEQPLPAEDWDGMAEVFAESALPVIADESCIHEADVARCAGFFHGINVKLTKCGGLTPGRRMLQEARFLGLQTMVGCMTESSIGISAIAQLLPMLDYVDMDGAVLIAQDIATGVSLDKGVVRYPDVPGTGVTFQQP